MTHRESVAGRYTGVGTSLNRFIREVVRECEAERSHAPERGEDPGESAEDYAIREGARGLAVVRVWPDGGHRVSVSEPEDPGAAQGG